jgi:metal transporter CNNM
MCITLTSELAPVAWPIAKLLDWVLGSDEGNTYKKAELKSFLQFHREGQEPLRDDEVSVRFVFGKRSPSQYGCGLLGVR